MKNVVLAIGLTLWCATVAAAGSSHIDRGWMTNNMGGQCQMLHGVWAADGSNVMLMVQVSLLGAEANAALPLFATERFVRVKMKDGTTTVFSFPPKGYETAKPMFDACARSSQQRG